jgi:hypothetical protein
MFSDTVLKSIFRSANEKARNGILPAHKEKYSAEYEWNAEAFSDIAFCSKSDLEGYSVKMEIVHLK